VDLLERDAGGADDLLNRGRLGDSLIWIGTQRLNENASAAIRQR